MNITDFYASSAASPTAGIVGGLVAGIALCILVAFVVLRRRKQRSEKRHLQLQSTHRLMINPAYQSEVSAPKMWKSFKKIDIGPEPQETYSFPKVKQLAVSPLTFLQDQQRMAEPLGSTAASSKEEVGNLYSVPNKKSMKIKSTMESDAVPATEQPKSIFQKTSKATQLPIDRDAVTTVSYPQAVSHGHDGTLSLPGSVNSDQGSSNAVDVEQEMQRIGRTRKQLTMSIANSDGFDPSSVIVPQRSDPETQQRRRQQREDAWAKKKSERKLQDSLVQATKQHFNN